MSKLVGFLKDLGRDADLEREFEKDPDGVMERAGLSDDEREAVSSGDLDKIRSMSGLKNVSTTNSTVKSYD
jgi:hypothetical protein